MIDNIKQLWNLMQPDTKKSVIETILEEFKLTSEMYFKQHWLYMSNIPEKHQERVLEIFQNAMKIQHKNTGQIIGA